MVERKVYEIVDNVPEGFNIIESRWVFKIKRNSNGEIIEWKARLVAKGYTQRYGKDYLDTFSPTLKQDSLRIIISFAAERSFKIRQLDVKAAYLYADLKEEIYMKAPEGDPYHDKGFWKLKKALYGLKQAAREWNENISNFIQNMGFKRLISEPCMFVKYKGSKVVCIISVYVDDFLVTGTDEEIENSVKLLKEKYTITDVGDANFIIGIKIDRIGNGYLLHQERYLMDILDKFGLSNCRYSKIPGPLKTTNNEKEPKTERST